MVSADKILRFINTFTVIIIISSSSSSQTGLEKE